jgi:ribonuclease HI
MSKVIIYSDGASKGNPGASGIGVVLSDQEGKMLAEISEFVGVTTNNVAEYKALIRGLEEAIKLEADEVEISTDSELLARQISGVYKVKAPHLKELHALVISLLRTFRKVSISHVMREHNRLADKLAKSGSNSDPARLNING